MASLSSSLLKKFVDVTSDSETRTGYYAYGTAIVNDDNKYVQLDGSDSLTSVSLATDLATGDRVLIYVENHTASVIGNVTCPASGRTAIEVDEKLLDVETWIVGELQAISAEFEYVYTNYVDTEWLIANYVSSEYLLSNYIMADTIESTYATIGELTVLKEYVDSLEASEITVEYLETYYANITDLNAVRERVVTLEANQITTEYLDANYATIEELNSTNINVGTLDATIAEVESLLSGVAGVGILETIHLTADNVTIDNAVIKDAMIDSITADKITAGTIYTAKIRIQTDENDESLYIDNSLIQMSENDLVRFQAGKDATGEYGLYIWNSEGEIMFDATGATSDGIGKEVIVNTHVSDDANIAGHKLDIASVASELNDDGSLVVSAGQVTISNTTLDAWYTTITTETDGLLTDIDTLQTQLTAISGQITAKVWESDIESAIAGIDIGATQILRCTNSCTSLTSSSRWANGTWRSASGGTGTRESIEIDDAPNANIKLGWKLQSESGTVDISQDYVPVTNGDTYTQSCYIRGSGTLRMQYGNSSGNYSVVSTVVNSDDWIKVYRTWTLEERYAVGDVTNIYFGVTSGTGPVEVCGMKLELGTVATDWSPAPEDVESSITTLTDNYSQIILDINSVTTTVGTLTTTTDSLSSQVASLVVESNSFSVTLENLQSKLNNLDIGGRNYLLNTKELAAKAGVTSIGSSWSYQGLDENGFGVILGDPSKASNNYVGFYTEIDATTDCLGEQNLVFGMDLYAPNVTSLPTGYAMLFSIWGSNNGTSWSRVAYKTYYMNSSAADINSDSFADNEWFRLIIKFSGTKLSDTWSGSIGNIGNYSIIRYVCEFGLRSNNTVSDPVYIRKPKLELGTVATDWSPAPEDADTTYASKASLVLEMDSNGVATLSAEANYIDLVGDQISINTSNFLLTRDGHMEAYDGIIGGWNIGLTSLYNNTTSLTEKTDGLYLGIDGIHSVSGLYDTVITSGAIYTNAIYLKSGGTIGPVETTFHIGLDEISLHSDGTNGFGGTYSGGGYYLLSNPDNFWYINYDEYRSSTSEYINSASILIKNSNHTIELGASKISLLLGTYADADNANYANTAKAGSDISSLVLDKAIITLTNNQGSSSSTDTYFRTISWSGNSISFGVGSGGNNRGIYDYVNSRWMIYMDSSNALHLNGTTTVGSAYTPIYLNSGVPTACTSTTSNSWYIRNGWVYRGFNGLAYSSISVPSSSYYPVSNFYIPVVVIYSSKYYLGILYMSTSGSLDAWYYTSYGSSATSMPSSAGIYGFVSYRYQ